MWHKDRAIDADVLVEFCVKNIAFFHQFFVFHCLLCEGFLQSVSQHIDTLNRSFDEFII